MKKEKNNATIVASDERNEIAQELAKVIILCGSDIMSPLMKCGVLNLSEACHKKTNGAIDNVIIENGTYTIINNNGISQTFNSIGHSEEEVAYVLSSSIKYLMDYNDIVKPLEVASEVVDSADGTRVLSADGIKEQRVAYNEEIKEALSSISKELDGLEKRAFSQRLRGLCLKCAHRSNFELLSKAGLDAHYAQMTDDNKYRVREVYYFFNQTMPDWLRAPMVNTANRTSSNSSVERIQQRV